MVLRGSIVVEPEWRCVFLDLIEPYKVGNTVAPELFEAVPAV